MALMSIIYFLGGDEVPELMLGRACEPMQIWGSEGQIKSRMFPADVRDDAMTKTFRDAKDLGDTTEGLEALGLVIARDEAFGSFMGRGLKLEAGVRKEIEQATTEKSLWLFRSFMLVCHTFPSDSNLNKM